MLLLNGFQEYTGVLKSCICFVAAFGLHRVSDQILDCGQKIANYLITHACSIATTSIGFCAICSRRMPGQTY
jgi:hypothetical protein